MPPPETLGALNCTYPPEAFGSVPTVTEPVREPSSGCIFAVGTAALVMISVMLPMTTNAATHIKADFDLYVALGLNRFSFFISSLLRQRYTQILGVSTIFYQWQQS